MQIKTTLTLGIKLFVTSKLYLCLTYYNTEKESGGNCIVKIKESQLGIAKYNFDLVIK